MSEKHTLIARDIYDRRLDEEERIEMIASALSRIEAETAQERDELRALVNDICDLYGIGAAARSCDAILANIENSKRRSECLGRVEWEFFTTTELDEDGEAHEECPLSWGANSQEYAEQFRGALAALKQETEARVLESLKREPDGYAYSYPSPFGGEVIRFSNGEEYNGQKPLCAVPYWLGEPATKTLPTSPKSVADTDVSTEGGLIDGPHGCHCDLEPGMKPDKCVLDDDRPQDCGHARALQIEGKSKWQCKEWRPIQASPNNLPTSPKSVEGMKLVPVKPTKEMIQAAYDRDRDGTTPLYYKVLEAMLQASPDTDLSVSGEVIGGLRTAVEEYREIKKHAPKSVYFAERSVIQMAEKLVDLMVAAPNDGAERG